MNGYRLILSLCIARIVSTHLIALPSTGGAGIGMTKAVLWVVPGTQNRQDGKIKFYQQAGQQQQPL